MSAYIWLYVRPHRCPVRKASASLRRSSQRQHHPPSGLNFPRELLYNSGAPPWGGHTTACSLHATGLCLRPHITTLSQEWALYARAHPNPNHSLPHSQVFFFFPLPPFLFPLFLFFLFCSPLVTPVAQSLNCLAGREVSRRVPHIWPLARGELREVANFQASTGCILHWEWGAGGAPGKW